jgi:hypothetical protein
MVDDPPPTDRDPYPLFKTLVMEIPPERGMGARCHRQLLSVILKIEGDSQGAPGGRVWCGGARWVRPGVQRFTHDGAGSTRTSSPRCAPVPLRRGAILRRLRTALTRDLRGVDAPFGADPCGSARPTRRRRGGRRTSSSPVAGMAPIVMVLGAIDGYRIERIDREGTEAVVILRRINPPDGE